MAVAELNGSCCGGFDWRFVGLNILPWLGCALGHYSVLVSKGFTTRAKP